MEHQLKRLSKVNNNTAVKIAVNALPQGSHCPMHTALVTMRKIKGISTLVIGSNECGYYSRFVMNKPVGKHGELHYVYEMDSNEIVFGCREGLIEAIKEMGRQGAKYIMLILTCVPALIGEDPSSIEDELGEDNQVKLMVYDGAHFKRNGYQSGYTDTIDAIMNKIIASAANGELEEDIIEYSDKNSNIIVLGEHKDRIGSSELQYLIEELSNNQHTVSCMESLTSIQNFIELKKAKHVIVTKRMYWKLVKTLGRKCKTNYSYLFQGYDSSSIEANYRAILVDLDCTIADGMVHWMELKESEISKLENTLLSLHCEHIDRKEFSVFNSDLDSLGISLYLTSLGMKARVLHIDEWTELESNLKLEYQDFILANQMDPYVTYLNRSGKIEEIEHHNGIYIKKSLQYSYGYERTIELLHYLISLYGGQ